MSNAGNRNRVYAETLGRIEGIVAADMDNVLPDPQSRVELVRAALADMQTRLTTGEEATR
ncbi:hypothetical protein AB0C02_32395 [Micromonospora sp. NPDC048999]|uniref:hypothetical protein n=1 Tax=Micromonospora sp. NPDC048999 TaxID=3155391 RepID=UPI0033C7B7B0